MSRLGLVVFGASVYENHDELTNHRFANSAKEFEAVCTDPTIIPNSTTTVLNLFDKPQFPGETITSILDFVNEDFETVIIYYCGHGDISKRKDEYFVFLRSSRRDRRNATLLNIPSLILDVERISSGKKIYFVLDACYSGDVINQMKEFMDAGAAASLYENPFEDLSNNSGIAVFAATRGSDVALAKKEDLLTLFTGSFVDGLKKGVPYRAEQPSLSWLDVRDYIVRATYERLGADAPIPKIVSLDDKYADITRVPFFANLAYVAPSSARTKSSRKPRKIISQEESEHYFWSRIPDYAGPEVFDDFLRKFPNGTYNLVALALLRAKLEQKNDDELTQFIADSPHSQGAVFAKTRLEELRWHQIRETEDIAALEAFVASTSNKQIVGEARRRIDELKSPPVDEPSIAVLGLLRNIWSNIPAKVRSSATVVIGLVAAVVLWGVTFLDNREVVQKNQFPQELATAGNDIAKLTAFIDRCQASANCPVLADAREKLAQAKAQANAQVERERQTAQFRSDFQSSGNDIAKLTAFIDRCQASANCPVLSEAQQRLQAERARQFDTAQFRADLQTAGSDPAKLTVLVTRCRASPNCTVLAEAEQRLLAERGRQNEIAQFRTELQGAGPDIAKLTAFIDRCLASANCPFIADAHEKLAQAKGQANAQAERERQAAQFRSDFQSSGNDIAKLTAFIDRCQASPNCPVLSEARQRLQAERTRQIEIAQFRSDLQAAGNDPARLTALVTRCGTSPNCPVLSEAQQRLQAERTRFDTAQFRADLQTAGSDPAKLTVLITRCRASPSCTILAEAEQRLLAERGRQNEIAQFRTELQGAGIDIAKLAAFADRCQASPNCPVLAEAQQRLQAERSRQFDIAQFRADLQTAGSDPAKLTVLITRCRASSNCTVLAEAEKRLQVERERRAGTQTIASLASFAPYPNDDLNVVGELLQTLPNTDFGTCVDACHARADCKAYTFDKWNRMCFLKSNFTTLQRDPKSDSGIRKGQKKTERSSERERSCGYANTVFSGEIVESLSANSVASCKRSCADNEACVAYTFLVSDRVCRILSNPKDRKKDDRNGQSGIKAQKPPGSWRCD